MKSRPLLLLIVAMVIASAVAAYLALVYPRPAMTAPRTECTYPGQGATWDAGEPRRAAAVVGDSLLGQAQGPLVALAAQRCHTADVWADAGSAPCDMLPDYGARMAAAGPSRVVLAWVGNVGSSPCMVAQMGARFGTARWGADPNGPETLTAAEIDYAGLLYEEAVRAMVGHNLANNRSTVIVLPPPMRPGTYHWQMEAELLERYERVAARYGGVRTTALPRTLLGGAAWAKSIAGQRVRHTDHTHLYAPLGGHLWAAGVVDAGTAP